MKEETKVTAKFTKRELLELATNVDLFIEEFKPFFNKDYEIFLKGLQLKLHNLINSFDNIPF